MSQQNPEEAAKALARDAGKELGREIRELILKNRPQNVEQGEGKLNAETVLSILNENGAVPPATSIDVAEVSLASFDELLGGAGVFE